MKKAIKRLISLFHKPTILEIRDLKQEIKELKQENFKFNKVLTEISIQDYLYNHLYSNEKYLNNKRLNKFEFQTFSQYGEDGIIDEIFSRLSVKNGFFVEFGVENGLECNSTNLLVKDWKGVWIESSLSYCSEIQSVFKNEIQQQKLKLLNQFVTDKNIEHLLQISDVPQDFDLLSIDIDFNDYYIWEAIKNYKPKVVVIEYNAIFRPNTKYIVQYNNNGNEGIFSSHFGASLYSLELLAREKEYSLVGCSFSGVNAFFVRNDLLHDSFETPYTAKNHYESQRYFLYCKLGHQRKWGNISR